MFLLIFSETCIKFITISEKSIKSLHRRSNALSVKAVHENAKVWYAQELNDLELLSATYITHSFCQHTHEDFAISVIERGIQGFHYRGSTQTAPANHVVVINPGEVHTSYAVSQMGWTYRMLYPNVSLLQQVASEVAGRTRPIPYFPMAVIQDEQLFKLILGFHIALEKPTSKLEQQSRFLWTLTKLIIRFSDDRPVLRSVGKERLAIKEVRDCLHSSYAENLSLEQLARIANLSPFHLIRVFRQEFGLPPHAYLTQVRVHRAKALLSLGCPIVQVALETGFVDQSHLTKKFKRIIGVTPREYKLSSKNKIARQKTVTDHAS
jgi:AraC-like DNA-binding protein